MPNLPIPAFERERFSVPNGHCLPAPFTIYFKIEKVGGKGNIQKLGVLKVLEQNLIVIQRRTSGAVGNEITYQKLQSN